VNGTPRLASGLQGDSHRQIGNACGCFEIGYPPQQAAAKNQCQRFAL